MQIAYKNKRLERTLIAVNALTAAVVAASFVTQFGFDRPLLPVGILRIAQAVLVFIFITEKIIRLFNSVSKVEYLWGNWFEIPLLLALGIAVFGFRLRADWFGAAEPSATRHLSVGVYLVLQVVIKVCRTGVSLAASGRNPTRTLIASFLVLIVSGASLLMLPRSAADSSCVVRDAYRVENQRITQYDIRNARYDNNHRYKWKRRVRQNNTRCYDYQASAAPAK